MLDIQFIRENTDKVKQNAVQKNVKADIDALLRKDEQRRGLLQQIELLRQERNEHTGTAKGIRPTDEQVAKGRELKEKLSQLESELDQVVSAYESLLKTVPNMSLDDVPVGASEDENQIIKEVGEKRHFEFEPKTHWQIAEARGLIDKQRAAKVSGARFAYIKDGLVELQFAIIQFVFGTLGNEDVIQQVLHENNLHISPKPFRPVLPPVMLKTEVYDAMDRLEPRDDRYRVGEENDSLWLEGSAEHTLGPMYMDEIVDQAELPIRYVGYAPSFRREAGTYGKDTEGIIRMHQFDKLEMEVFSTADTGRDEHALLIGLQEYMMQQLGIPYHVLLKCTADIGKPNARGVDIEAWMPGDNRYLETHTADYMTDYQARRLKTRTRLNGEIQLVHTNDATAFALGRIMAAIIENYQQEDGQIEVPTVLKPYISNKSYI